jgi:hypothetical protein
VKLFWYVMASAVNLKDLEGILKNPTGPTETKMLAKLKDSPQMMNELGRIVALDVFIGNGDRFVLREGAKKWVIANKGNLFFLADKEVTRLEFGGLDFYEPSSLFNNYFESLDDQLKRGQGMPWNGLCLKEGNAKQRDQLVDDIIDALNAELKPTGVVLGPKHKEAFRKGISDQKAAMQKYFKAFKAKPPPFASSYGVPVGITSRLKKLGW